MKKGSAVLYVVFAIIIFGLIISYIFSRTANSMISQERYHKQINEVYEAQLNNKRASISGIYEQLYETSQSQVSQ